MNIYSYISKVNDAGCPYLMKKDTFKVDGRKLYRSPDTVAEFIRDSLGIQDCAEEYLYSLCMDTKGHLIGCFEVTHGTVNVSLISPREIFQKALMLGAVSIFLTHNHPSGDPTPSDVDLYSTERVKQAGEMIGVRLIDHLIVTKNGWISMKEESLLREEEEEK